MDAVFDACCSSTPCGLKLVSTATVVFQCNTGVDLVWQMELQFGRSAIKNSSAVVVRIVYKVF